MRKLTTEERRTKTFTMRLTAPEAERLYIKASEAGLTIGELMESFAQDLICGSQSHGSDERDYANMWYDRCHFLMPSNSLLYYLLNYAGEESVKEAVEDWDLLKNEEARLAGGIDNYCDEEDMAEEADNAAYRRRELEDLYREYEQCRGKKGRGLEEEMKDLIKWQDDLNALISEGDLS